MSEAVTVELGELVHEEEVEGDLAAGAVAGNLKTEAVVVRGRER